MSYESTTCPCGGRKERETMICDPCKAHIASAPCNDLLFCEDHRNPVESRRAMAIMILAACRRRGKAKPLPLSYSL
jgi:hypothetical protein